jgi:polygalacturonase
VIPALNINPADAHLIAAAPELLAALKNALNVLAGIAAGDLKTIEKDSPAIQLARAAIAKATGQKL